MSQRMRIDIFPLDAHAVCVDGDEISVRYRHGPFVAHRSPDRDNRPPVSRKLLGWDFQNNGIRRSEHVDMPLGRVDSPAGHDEVHTIRDRPLRGGHTKKLEDAVRSHLPGIHRNTVEIQTDGKIGGSRTDNRQISERADLTLSGNRDDNLSIKPDAHEHQPERGGPTVCRCACTFQSLCPNVVSESVPHSGEDRASGVD